MATQFPVYSGHLYYSILSKPDTLIIRYLCVALFLSEIDRKVPVYFFEIVGMISKVCKQVFRKSTPVVSEIVRNL